VDEEEEEEEEEECLIITTAYKTFFILLLLPLFPQHPLHNLCYSLEVKDQISHLYKTLRKIIVVN
jgi:hypothetical protein